MAKMARALPADSPGYAIRRRMHEVGKSQAELARIMGRSQGWVSQYLFGEPGRTIERLCREAPLVVERMLDLLEWTPGEFSAATNIELFNIASQRAGAEPHDRAIPIGHRMAPIMGKATMGKPYEYPVPEKLWRRSTTVYQVEGDSMTTANPNSLQDGDWVLVDTAITNQVHGKAFLVEIIGDGYTVKRALNTPGGWLWMPDNPAHQALKPDGVRIVGMVYAGLGQRDV